jgi:hypothetical protein
VKRAQADLESSNQPALHDARSTAHDKSFLACSTGLGALVNALKDSISSPTMCRVWRIAIHFSAVKSGAPAYSGSASPPIASICREFRDLRLKARDLRLKALHRVASSQDENDASRR